MELPGVGWGGGEGALLWHSPHAFDPRTGQAISFEPTTPAETKMTPNRKPMAALKHDLLSRFL